MNADFRVALENIVSKLKSETSITGIIFRSAKKLSLRAAIWMS